MANAYSILRNYGDYVAPYDFNLMAKGLAYKQQKYDANDAKIQSQIDQITSLQLVKGVDKEYLNQRVGALVDQVNQTGGLDLSSTGVTRNIQNHIKQALDSTVMSAYSSSQNHKKAEEEFEYYKKEKHDLYSPINEAHAREVSGMNEWLNNPEPGAKFNGVSYTPYSDVLGKLDKKMLEISKAASKQVFEYRDEKGLIIKKTREGLTTDEIRLIAENSLSSQDRKQLQINGWYSFKGKSEEQANGILNDYVQGRTKVLDDQIGILNTKRQATTSPKEVARLDDRISILTNMKDDVERRVKHMTRSDGMIPVNDIGSFLETERLVNGVASTYGNDFVSTELKTDNAYFKTLDLQMKQLGLELKYGGKGDSEPSPVFTGRVLPTKEIESKEKADIEKYQTLNTTLESRVNDIYNQLTDNKADVKISIDSIVSELRKDEKWVDASDVELKEQAILQLSNYGKNINVATIPKIKALRDTREELGKIQTGLINSTKATILREDEAENLFNLVFEITNSNITTADDKGNKMSYAKYLTQNGITTFNDLKDNPKEYNKLLTQNYGDALLSRLGDLYERADGRRFWKLDKDARETTYYVNMLSQYTGEEGVDIDDLFDRVDTNVVYSGKAVSTPTELLTLKEDSPKAQKTLRILKSLVKTGSYDNEVKGYLNPYETKRRDRAGNIVSAEQGLQEVLEHKSEFSTSFDNSFMDDLDARNIISYDARKGQYREALGEYAEKQPDYLQMTVDVKTNEELFYEFSKFISGAFKHTVIDEAGHARSRDEGFEPTKSPISVFEDKTGLSGKGKVYILEQEQTNSKGQTINLRAEVREKDLLKNSIVRQSLDFGRTQSRFTASNLPPINIAKTEFAEPGNIEYEEQVQEYVFGGVAAPQMDFLTTEGAKKDLEVSFPRQMFTPDRQETKVNKIVNSVIDNGKDFSLEVVPNTTKSKIYVKVNYKDNQDNTQTLATIDPNSDKFNTLSDRLYFTPQLFLHTALTQLLKETELRVHSNNTKITHPQLLKLAELYNIQ